MLISVVHAGSWNLLNPTTLSFEGEIESDEYERFKATFNPSVKNLILKSGGGETTAALQIARHLLPYEVTVIVHEKCLSSCANYLFLAGKIKKIEKGIVGYHGNVTACFGEKKWPEVAAEFRSEGLDEASIEVVRSNFQAQMVEEKNFLNRVGVSQELFDRSCENDKGMGDGQTYSFLLPSPDTFLMFGVKNVEGHQDLELMKSYPWLIFD